MGNANTVKYVYVCSAARSGSTITDLLLGGHSKVASLGELVFLGKAITQSQNCSCGVEIEKCKEWSKVFELAKRAYKIDLTRTPYALDQWMPRSFNIIDRDYQDGKYLILRKTLMVYLELRMVLPKIVGTKMPLPGVLKERVGNTFKLYDLIRTAWQKSIVIDSSKNVRQAVEIYMRSPENTRIIFLVRDGRGVFNSGLRGGYSIRASMNSWLKYNLRAQKYFERYVPVEHIFPLKYEELVSNPENILRRLCDFLSIEYEPAMADLEYGDRHIFEGNDTRFKRQIGLRLDEKWKHELAEKEQAYFRANGAQLNKMLGYDT